MKTSQREHSLMEGFFDRAANGSGVKWARQRGLLDYLNITETERVYTSGVGSKGAPQKASTDRN